MKIIITEDQARRLNILNPNSDPIVKLEQYVKLKTEVIDGMFQNLVNLSLIEIMNPDFNLDLDNVIDDVKSGVNKLYIAGYRYLDTLSDDESEGLDVKLDDASRLLTDKLYAMEIIVNKVQDLKQASNEFHLTDVFKNQEPLDITNSEN